MLCSWCWWEYIGGNGLDHSQKEPPGLWYGTLLVQNKQWQYITSRRMPIDSRRWKWWNILFERRYQSTLERITATWTPFCFALKEKRRDGVRVVHYLVQVHKFKQAIQWLWTFCRCIMYPANVTRKGNKRIARPLSPTAMGIPARLCGTARHGTDPFMTALYSRIVESCCLPQNCWGSQ